MVADLARALSYFAGQYILPMLLADQHTEAFTAQKLQMSGGLSRPTALTTRAATNATGILMRVVLKRRVQFARFLVTAACGEDTATPALLCLGSVVDAVCGIRLQKATGVELTVTRGVCLRGSFRKFSDGFCTSGNRCVGYICDNRASGLG